MQARCGRDQCIDNRLAPHFEEFISLLSGIKDHEKLFPKTCKACGGEFRSLGEYLCKTKPKGHVFDDCSKVMKRPFTMIYRHCVCGNTLVLSLTSEILPELERFWSMIAAVAEELDVPVTEVVTDFAGECDRFFAGPGDSPE
jgi:hypothetical protein